MRRRFEDIVDILNIFDIISLTNNSCENLLDETNKSLGHIADIFTEVTIKCWQAIECAILVSRSIISMSCRKKEDSLRNRWWKEEIC